MKLSHLITALVFTISTGAFAMHCPLDMKTIDAVPALGPSLSADDLARVKALRTAGMATHKSGKHGESVDNPGDAMRIPGIE